MYRVSALVAATVAMVEQMLARRATRAEIVEACAKEGLSERTAASYMARVRERWLLEGIESPNREQQRLAMLGELQADVEEFRKQKKATAVVATRRLMMDLLGLAAPVQVEHHHTSEVVLPSPEKVAEFRAKVLAQQRAMLEAEEQQAAADAMVVRPVALIEVESADDDVGAGATDVEFDEAGRAEAPARADMETIRSRVAKLNRSGQGGEA